MNSSSDNRRYPRYDTEVKVHFYVPYELNVKVDFEVAEEGAQKSRYSGVTKNISAGGLMFTSEKRLEKGGNLQMELYLPNAEKPIALSGDVRWSRPLPTGLHFSTGVQITKVEGQTIENGIYYDQEHQVIWSPLLETVLGNFGLLHKKFTDNI